MNSFQRGHGVKKGLSIGIKSKAEKWLEHNNLHPTGAEFSIDDISGGNINVTVKDGVAIFRNVDSANIGNKYRIKINQAGGKLVVVSELSDIELYHSIRNICNEMLDNCLNKSLTEQEKWIYGNNNPSVVNPRLAVDSVKKSEDFIKRLPENPKPNDVKSLQKEIKCGCLEFMLWSKPHMSVYFQELMKRKLI